LHFSALVERIESADDDKRQRINRAAAETLDGAEKNHRLHALGGATERGAKHKNTDAGEHEIAPAKEIGEFAEYRSRQRRGEHIDGKHPAIKLQAAESGHDGWHRRADNGRVDGEQEDDQHDPGGGQDPFRIHAVGWLFGKIHVA